jgi:CheY-like chemotaxis protein
MYQRQRESSAQRPEAPARTVLVVDNHEAFRTEVCRILRGAGFRAVPARSGIEALWFAEHHQADLLITGLLLPEVDGYHLGIPFRRLERSMPVIFTGERPRSQLLPEGTLPLDAPYLHQPFPPGECIRIVHRVLASWRPPLVA